MQSITALKICNLKPTIIIDTEGIEAIKHIVDIAPQEAQWFHCVTPKTYKDRPGEIFLYLSTKLYIPKQNTSKTQVDSSSAMMMEFYNELKTDHPLEELNSILSSMTCWCHSHHNMSPSPSGQDFAQFNNFVKMAEDQTQKTWQIMLIFNKKNQFYSKAYDPNTNLIFEGVDIIVDTPAYDFSYLDKAAKEKFLKPKPLYKYKNSWGSVNKASSTHFKETSFNAKSTLASYEDINESIASDILADVYYDCYADTSSFSLGSINPKKDPETRYNNLASLLDDQELLWLSFIIDDSPTKTPNVFTSKQINSYLDRHHTKVQDIYLNYFAQSTDTVSDLRDKLSLVIKMQDFTTPHSLKDFIERIQVQTKGLAHAQ
jgi:hypothetical protein